jgi:hypothetical protein
MLLDTKICSMRKTSVVVLFLFFRPHFLARQSLRLLVISSTGNTSATGFNQKNLRASLFTCPLYRTLSIGGKMQMRNIACAYRWYFCVTLYRSGSNDNS